MSTSNDSALAPAALRRPVAAHRAALPAGAVHHTDLRSLDASEEYRTLLASFRIVPGTSGAADRGDDPVAERSSRRSGRARRARALPDARAPERFDDETCATARASEQVDDETCALTDTANRRNHPRLRSTARILWSLVGSHDARRRVRPSSPSTTPSSASSTASSARIQRRLHVHLATSLLDLEREEDVAAHAASSPRLVRKR